jgi:FAD:protein FMN transferase
VKRFRSMGCEVVVVGASRGIGELFDDDDRRFTRFADDSELARVNRAHGPVLVSKRFARAVAAALSAARQTGGLVDPTLLGALEAAGYDRDFAELRDAGPAVAGAAGCWDAVTLHGRLLTLPPGVRLDLNGVVKSMAADDALALIGDGWVAAGGDLATTRPLEVALPGGGGIRLQRGALATSGSRTRRWIRGGRPQHHLIDPRSGRPAESPWEQVTVCGASCLMADVAAKAAFLLGADGPEWLDGRGMAGRFLRPDGSVAVNDVWRAAADPRSAAPALACT